MVSRLSMGSESGEEDTSVRTLLRRLGTDTESLLRAEVALAKLEFRDLARQAALDGAKVGAAVAVAFVGSLAIVAWLVLALGDLLGDSYGIAALLVGVLLLLAGGLLARAGMKGLKRAPGPQETMRTLRDGGRWAQRELGDLRRGLKRSESPRLRGGADGLPPARVPWEEEEKPR